MCELLRKVMQHNEKLNLYSNVSVFRRAYWNDGCNGGCICDVDYLKTCLVEEWQMFDQKIINWATKQWRLCLRA